MLHYTTIEIDEIDTEVKIEFESRFGEIEIIKITDIGTGNAIAPDLFNDRLANSIYAELHEVAADYNAETLAEKNRRWNPNYFEPTEHIYDIFEIAKLAKA